MLVDVGQVKYRQFIDKSPALQFLSVIISPHSPGRLQAPPDPLSRPEADLLQGGAEGETSVGADRAEVSKQVDQSPEYDWSGSAGGQSQQIQGTFQYNSNRGL